MTTSPARPHHNRPAAWDLSDEGIGDTFVPATLSYGTYQRAIALASRWCFNRGRLQEVAMTRSEPSSTDGRSGCPDAGAIGSSPAWQRVLTAAVRVAATEATVFLQGESGSGKEVIARLIHRASPRKHGPFVAINCAAGRKSVV